MRLATTAAMLGASSLSSLAYAQETSSTGLELATGLYYAEGKYGADVETTTFYVPLTAKLHAERWRLEATLPFLRIQGPGNVLGGTGSPIVRPGDPSSVTRRKGLGDIVLGASWIFPNTETLPYFEFTGRLKLPTADDGLGTGQADFSLQADLSQPLSNRTTLFGTLGYQWLGDSELFEFKDGPYGAAGIDFQASDVVNFGATLDYRRRSFEGFGDQANVTPYLSQSFGDRLKLTGYGSIGLTTSSPDFALGFQISFYPKIRASR